MKPVCAECHDQIDGDSYSVRFEDDSTMVFHRVCFPFTFNEIEGGHLHLTGLKPDVKERWLKMLPLNFKLDQSESKPDPQCVPAQPAQMVCAGCKKPILQGQPSCAFNANFGACAAAGSNFVPYHSGCAPYRMELVPQTIDVNAPQVASEGLVQTRKVPIVDIYDSKYMEDLQRRLMRAQIASCTCRTKTPDIQYHDTDCRYRVLAEAQHAIRLCAEKIAGEMDSWNS